jgi:hypothetical protein
MSQLLKRRPSAEYCLFAQAWVGLTATRLALRWVSIPSLARRVWRAFSAAEPLPEEKRLPLARVLRCAGAAARFMPLPTTCLATAIVVQSLLHRHGYAAQLRIGVRDPVKGRFAAHAWLEYQGAVIVGGPASVVNQYQPLPGVEQLIA